MIMSRAIRDVVHLMLHLRVLKRSSMLLPVGRQSRNGIANQNARVSCLSLPKTEYRTEYRPDCGDCKIRSIVLQTAISIRVICVVEFASVRWQSEAEDSGQHFCQLYMRWQRKANQQAVSFQPLRRLTHLWSITLSRRHEIPYQADTALCHSSYTMRDALNCKYKQERTRTSFRDKHPSPPSSYPILHRG